MSEYKEIPGRLVKDCVRVRGLVSGGLCDNAYDALSTVDEEGATTEGLETAFQEVQDAIQALEEVENELQWLLEKIARATPPPKEGRGNG